MADRRDLMAELARPVRHEVNNLLAALSGTAELMQRAGGSEREMARAARLTAAAARLQALLHAYLALGAPPPEGTAAAAVFDAVAPLVRLTIGPARTLEMVAAPGLPALAAPPAALQVAILTLAQDAAAAAPDGPVRLTLEAAPGGAVLAAHLEPVGAAPPPVFLAAQG
jgi:nitrogen-specific signal transduction histidine kinase